MAYYPDRENQIAVTVLKGNVPVGEVRFTEPVVEGGARGRAEGTAQQLFE
jgi:hypothetical protein